MLVPRFVCGFACVSKHNQPLSFFFFFACAVTYITSVDTYLFVFFVVFIEPQRLFSTLELEDVVVVEIVDDDSKMCMVTLLSDTPHTEWMYGYLEHLNTDSCIDTINIVVTLLTYRLF